MATYQGDAAAGIPGITANSTASSTAALVANNSGGGNAIVATSPGVPIYAETASTNSGYAAIYGKATGAGGNGVLGLATASGGRAIYANATGTSSYGVYVDAAAGGSNGIYVNGTSAVSNGVFGSGFTGVYGISMGGNGSGVYGHVGSGARAGTFSGDVWVIGTLTKSAGSFLIDHPLDPANKYLEHSFVESSERKNVYDGVGSADAAGELEVQFPAYFDALNEDFRYQLTALDSAAPGLHVKERLRDGRMVIAGAAPGQSISWQVTGIRKDAFAAANPLVVEADKPADERGLFLHPELFGESAEKSLSVKHFPARPQKVASSP